MEKPLLYEVIGLLRQSGVEHFVISPGSRNADIIRALARFEDIKTHVVADERSAAFIGIGLSLVSKNPVALVCTSGTALLNYAPAVAEAYYQGIPLIIISADRPEEWIDQDDSQTIRQPGVFANFIKGTYDIVGERLDADYSWYVNRIINEAVIRALGSKKGPVHLNIHLDGSVASVPKRIPEVRKISVVKPDKILSRQALLQVAETLAGKKIMLVAGFMSPDNKLQKAVSAFVSLPNVAVLAETVSNLHLREEDYMIDTVLFPLDEEQMASLAPDVVISMGGALISRKLKEFLRNNPPELHFALNDSDNLIDCFKALTTKVESAPAQFLSSVAKRLARIQKATDPYNALWSSARKRAIKSVAKVPWSDLKALSIILNSLPQETNLFLSNGTSVRYGQIIRYRLTHATYSNRGVSGIEGCTSTCLGGALIYDKQTCLITGDMSFLYDISAVTSCLAPESMRIIVLDNGGGDIFRFINATKDLEIREKFLCAPRDISIGLLADSVGWLYFYADSESSLNECLEEFFGPLPRPAILHLDTREAENAEILRNFLMNK